MIYSLVFSFAIQSGRNYKSKAVKDESLLWKQHFSSPIFTSVHFSAASKLSLFILSPTFIKSCFYCILLQYSFNRNSLEQQDLVWVLSKRKGFRLLRACLVVESNILEWMWPTWVSNSNSLTICQLRKKKLRAMMLSRVWRREKGTLWTGQHWGWGWWGNKHNVHATCSTRSSSLGVVDVY